MSEGAFLTDHNDIRQVLAHVKTIALIGASSNLERPSYEVMKFLLHNGFDVIPVNPGLAGKKILGKTVAAKLSDIKQQIDMVDIFRNSDAVFELMQETLQLSQRPRIFWTQLGVFDEEAARQGVEEGLIVVMDHCPKIELSRV